MSVELKSHREEKGLVSSSSSSERLNHSDDSHEHVMKVDRSHSVISVHSASVSHIKESISRRLTASSMPMNAPIDKLPKSTVMSLIVFGLASGLLHLLWYNTVLQLPPSLGSIKTDYAPCPIWLPIGSAASLVGNLIYFFLKQPVVFNRMVINVGVMIVCGAAFWPTINALDTGGLSETSVTVLISVLFFLEEINRGLLSVMDYGICAYFEPYGIGPTMSVAVSAGESIGGIIPWLTFLLFSFSDPTETKDYVWSVGLAVIINTVVAAIYLLALFNAFKFTKPAKTVFDARIASELAAKILSKSEGTYEPVIKRLKKAIDGTKLMGFGIIIVFIGTLNIYPTVFPFGFSWIEDSEALIILGTFTLIDPVFRSLGFILPKLMKGRVMPKTHYLALAFIKLFLFVPLCVVPYYHTADNPPTWMNSLGAYLGLIIGIAIVQGWMVILGVYTYMCHLPKTPYMGLSASLVVIYIIIGVVIGQVLCLLYPLFR